METITLSPERKAQLDEYAHRHGQDSATALDEALGAWLDWERQDYMEAVEGIRRGYADFQAGRTQSLDVAFEELRRKHGFPH